MGWDSGARLRLKTLQERGVVAVRYVADGCNVELELLNCVGQGKYEFSPYSATDTKIATTKQELFAELPIGAAQLGGRMSGGRSIRTDYMLAGALTLPVMQAFPASSLVGNGCERATHVVSALYLGGFAMGVGAKDQVSGGVSLFGAGAGASQSRSAERIASEGDPEACARAQKTGQRESLCSVPLRIGLIPLDKSGTGTATASAKAAGLDLERGLVAHYLLDGNGRDRKGFGNARLNGNLSIQPDHLGRQSGAISFDGQTYFSAPGNQKLPTGNAPRSVSVWVKPSLGRDWGVIAAWGRTNKGQTSSIATVNGSGAFAGYWSDCNGNAAVDDGRWHHLAFTYDGTSLRLYIDGREDCMANLVLDTQGSTLVIGRTLPDHADGNFFEGLLDDLRIYDRALTPEEIAQLAS